MLAVVKRTFPNRERLLWTIAVREILDEKVLLRDLLI